MPTAEPICGCTDLTHEDVRLLIKSKELKSMPAVMAGAGLEDLLWVPCLPPCDLNYYLLADWPEEYIDDPQSRFINERKHANIQKGRHLFRCATHVGRHDHPG